MPIKKKDEFQDLPVFPLPNVVLFPQTTLPLHVFEARYRKMIQDVMDGPEEIAIALLEAGHESSGEAPPFHRVGTIGRMEDLQLLDDGRFLFNLVGTQRVNFEELPSSNPYRLVRARPRPDLTIDPRDPELERSKLELLASHGMLMRELGDESASTFLLNQTLAFEHAVNHSCATLPATPAVRQALLELDDPRERQRQALRMIDLALNEVLAIKAASGNGPAAELN